MTKIIVLIGHCGPDSSYLRMTVGRASREIAVVAADTEAELQRVLADRPSLLLINRQLDYGFEELDGTKLIARLRPDNPDLKMMLVSNYADAQDAAVRAGALPGFGKRELGSSRVAELLRDAIAQAVPAAQADQSGTVFKNGQN